MKTSPEAKHPLGHTRETWLLLPLHPQPQWLESWCSYLIRLAEANGLQSMKELAVLAGSTDGWRTVRAAPDYFFGTSIDRVAKVAGCRPSALLGTTFYYLVRHFASSTVRTRRFLRGSLAAHLRYCPHCLAMQAIPYYSLCWRFLAISGCHKHGCHLLDACGHCGTSLPCLPSLPQLAHCSTCWGDLRRCQTVPLTQEEQTHLCTRTKDLEMLLMPPEWGPEISSALLMGSGFTLLRQHKQLTKEEVASLMNRDEQIILEMEQGQWGMQATFFDYWQYTNLLGCTLSEMAAAAQFARKLQRQKSNKLDELARLVRSEESWASPQPVTQQKTRSRRKNKHS